MEDRINTVVIDYYGIPGSGKTTYSHRLAEKYRAAGKRVAEPSYDLDHKKSRIGRKIAKISIAIYMAIWNFQRTKAVIALVKDNGYTRDNGLFNQIVNIFTKLYALEKNYNRCDYIIFDEGLAQSAISLSVCNGVNAAENLEMLLRLAGPVGEIEFQEISLEPEKALEYIRKRNSCDTRIEKQVNDEQRAQMMKKYVQATEQISKSIKGE